uniref:NUC153 domain-containing protein n=1 Tax=Angiostrongylus cantonensis TaxID=6313 RepID=A0A0K0D3C8_ANGCA
NEDEFPADLIACSDSDDDSDKEKNRETLLSLISSNEISDGLQVDWYKSRGEGKNSEDEEDKKDESEVRNFVRSHESNDDEKDVDSTIKPRKKQVDWYKSRGEGKNSEDEEDKKDESEVRNFVRSHESNDDEKDVDSTIKPRKKQKNTYKAYMERRREERAKRKQKLRMLREKEREALITAGDQAKLKQKKNRVALKASMEKEDKYTGSVEAVANDERFKALFTDSAFAIEQSSKNYKGSKLIEKQVSAKWQAKKESVNEDKTNNNDIISKLKHKSTKWKGRR